MTPQAQQRAIAIACGWKDIVRTVDHRKELVGVNTHNMRLVHGGEYVESILPIPDYLNDLNAMHEAVMALPSNTRDLVNLKLCEITAGNFDHSETHDMDAALNATAAQRAEAFLKTIGKWVEETESQPCH